MLKMPIISLTEFNELIEKKLLVKETPYDQDPTTWYDHIFNRAKWAVQDYISTLPIHTSNEGYQRIYRSKETLPLFNLLEITGFFNYHVSNVKKRVVQVHQVVKYFRQGYKNYRIGLVCTKGELEIHHLDHNPENNSAENLVYVTPEENKALSMCVGGNYQGIVKLARLAKVKITKRFKNLMILTQIRTAQAQGISLSLSKQERDKFWTGILKEAQDLINSAKAFLERKSQEVKDTVKQVFGIIKRAKS